MLTPVESTKTGASVAAKTMRGVARARRATAPATAAAVFGPEANPAPSGAQDSTDLDAAATLDTFLVADPSMPSCHLVIH